MDHSTRQHQRSDQPFIRETYRRPLAGNEPAMSLFDRIAKCDRSAATECLATYGNLIWALAKTNTRSVQEAEVISECIFEDILNGEGLKLKDIAERQAIEHVAIRRIFRNRLDNRNDF